MQEHTHQLDFESKTILQKIEGCKDHVYGYYHEYLGRPCVYRHAYEREIFVAIPYGAYIVDRPEHGYDHDLLLVIAYINSYNKVEYCSAIKPESLIPIDLDTDIAKRTFHMIISGNYDVSKELKKENEELKKQIEELKK